MSFISTLIVSAGIIGMILLDDVDITEVNYTPISVDSFFLGFGAMFFALGGAATFPTVQNDMKNRNDFPKSAFLAFALVLFLYLPLSILGCLVYGDQLTENILDSVPPSAFKISIEILSVFHMIFALPLVISPCSLELEELLNIPQEFGWKRVALRSSIMAFILFVGVTVPEFGKVMHFIGGSVIVLTTNVFPCACYLQLISQKNPAWKKKYN
ncbi:aa_trans domain-containing protein [Trichonephila inaurata madagascariensis]|uniref:Aa_trans domain-containing protein n=1 Tax=Trichonephila inaurata madagascariensis TaxID=2747483 RepID=A0A8X6MFU7_9ARAC|nr:aa_trans domain-containing protein [Trichonephila inaurata madagascariensis]